MKILFLSHYFPPEVNAPATRTFEHCKVWVELGHEVTVVTCAPHHPMGKVYPGFRNKFYQVEEQDGIRVIRLLTYITANEGFLKRSLNYLFYMLACIFAAPFLPKTDVVVSTSPQFFNGLAGYFVSRMKRAKWILEIRDLWPESILAVGAVKSPTIVKTLTWLERFVYRKADHIVPVTNAFKTHIVENGGTDYTVSVVRNGVDLTKFSNEIGYDTVLADDIGVSGKFVAAYVGTHGMAHGLDIILDAAKKLEHERDIIFLMVGDGAERETLERKLEQSNLNNVIMLGQQPKQAMPGIWSISHISLVLLRKLPLFETVIPSKIFESMAMEKPIVMGVQGEAAEIIREADAGQCIEPGSADQLAKAVLDLYRDQERYLEIAGSSREYVATHFDRRVLATRMLQVIERTVNGSSKILIN